MPEATQSVAAAALGAVSAATEAKHWVLTGRGRLTLGPFQPALHLRLATAGDQTGHIRVWDLTANACSCELVPEIGTAVRSLTVAMDGGMMVAANNHGTCYVWRMMRGESVRCGAGFVWHGGLRGDTGHKVCRVRAAGGGSTFGETLVKGVRVGGAYVGAGQGLRLGPCVRQDLRDVCGRIARGGVPGVKPRGRTWAFVGGLREGLRPSVYNLGARLMTGGLRACMGADLCLEAEEHNRAGRSSGSLAELHASQTCV